jgi:hypothetical protein
MDRFDNLTCENGSRPPAVGDEQPSRRAPLLQEVPLAESLGTSRADPGGAQALAAELVTITPRRGRGHDADQGRVPRRLPGARERSPWAHGWPCPSSTRRPWAPWRMPSGDGARGARGPLLRRQHADFHSALGRVRQPKARGDHHRLVAQMGPRRPSRLRQPGALHHGAPGSLLDAVRARDVELPRRSS